MIVKKKKKLNEYVKIEDLIYESALWLNEYTDYSYEEKCNLVANPYIDHRKHEDKEKEDSFKYDRWKEQKEAEYLYKYEGKNYGKNCWKCNIFLGETIFKAWVGYLSRKETGETQVDIEYKVHKKLRKVGLISGSCRYQQVKKIPKILKKLNISPINILDVRPGNIMYLQKKSDDNNTENVFHIEIVTKKHEYRNGKIEIEAIGSHSIRTDLKKGLYTRNYMIKYDNSNIMYKTVFSEEKYDWQIVKFYSISSVIA